MDGTRPKPRLHFTADDIKEFRNFSIGDTIIVRAKGVITDLRLVPSGEEGDEMQGVDIDVTGIFADKAKVSSESAPQEMRRAYSGAQKKTRKSNMEG